MLAHRLLVPALLLAISAPAAAQNEFPAALRSLEPHQIVEAVMAERQTLGLTAVQEQRLESLHVAIRSEPHGYVATPSPGKAQPNARMRPMMSGQRVYADAMAMLTPEQRAEARARFTDPEYRLPSRLQGGQPATARPGEPLRRHAPGATPAEQSTQASDSAKDPLQHHGAGETPPAAQSDSGEPTNPVTHRP